jgi:hypothetical protein
MAFLGRSKTRDENSKPAKIKAAKTVSGARYVLFVGDEGTILIYIRGNQVQSRQYVPDASDQNLKDIRASLDNDPKAPLLMIIDSMDQSYVQQSLPPVSALSVNKLIKRRLDRDFGANDIKGAVLLGREQSGRKDWNFLMVSLERSRQLSMWLDFIYTLPNRFQGIYLLSVETETIVKNLERAMGVPKIGTGAKWKFFVSHNKVGGFRQVILHNGRIIFTRLAQPLGDSSPEVIAGNMEQEMQSTIEYMKRLAFDGSEELDIYIVASSAIKAAFDKNKFKANVFEILTPFELAQYLGIQGAAQPTDQFGDVILAAGISASPKHILTLTTPESKRYDQLYQLFRLQRAGAALIATGMVLYAFSLCYDIYSGYETSGDLDQKRTQHQAALNNLRDEIKRTNFDVDKMGDIIDLYQFLQKQRVDPLAFINKVQAVIKSPIVVKAVDWAVEDRVGAGNKPGLAPKTVVIMTLSFPGVTDVATFRVVSKKVIEDLKAIFKDYDIAFTKLPSQFSETEKLDITFGDAVKPTATGEAQDVQLTIREL